MPGSVHLNLDGAWVDGVLGIPVRDVRSWGPRLRYHGTRAGVEAFYREVEPHLAPFVLYGSGDFHYLAAVLLRRVRGPVTVVSFDNHPDWDVRPPHWSCGGWVNRALELPAVRQVSVWGCGNFELSLPSRLFANRAALRSGRLEVHAWAERFGPSVRRRFACISRDDWRERFQRYARELAGRDVYVTVDLDAVRAGETATNWESGLFSLDDIAWALGTLRQSARVTGGDVCGAASPPSYARMFQRLAGNWDHPKQPPAAPDQSRALNRRALETIWPALVPEHTA